MRRLLLMTPLAVLALVFASATSNAAIPQTLREAREDHSATVLPDGRVVVIGGFHDFGVSATAEILDPNGTGRRAEGRLQFPRRQHVAVLLQDGRVLVVGGGQYGDDGSQWSYPTLAEIWDPRTERFTPAGEMAVGRTFHTATLLSDGRVLVTGGARGFVGGLDGADDEIWDPRTLRFSPAGRMERPREMHTATLLSDGRVLVLGGQTTYVVSERHPEGGGTATVFHRGVREGEVWDPARSTWGPAVTLLRGRTDHTATLMPDGRVFIVGGEDDSAMRVTEMCDPGSRRCVPAAPLGFARVRHTTTTLPDGRLIAVGGENGTSTQRGSREVEEWSPTTRRWRTISALPRARHSHATALLADGRLAVVAGEDLDAGPRTWAVLRDVFTLQP
jgi:hypothetical protein